MNIHDTHIHPAQDNNVEAPIFPLLSQGDHPTLQTTCWYLHPCETERAVQELVDAKNEETPGTIGPEQWLETWMVVLGSMVDLEG